jgi:16S rRNA (guanine966-N2)-methyltransferase
MRIVAGTWRGTKLAEVGAGDDAARLRPTSDRVRESLFSILDHLDAVQGKRVLDLFAGTGALGLEALSRGAREAVLVENGRAGQKLIAENIKKLDAQDRVTLMRNDATALGAWIAAPFELVFLDPPYGKGLGQQALAKAREGGWLAPGALVAWEESAVMEPPAGFDRIDKRRFGDTHVTLLRLRARE